MSRRADREGISPEALSLPVAGRMFHVRSLENAAGWRKLLARETRRLDRDVARAGHAFEMGLAKSQRGRLIWGWLA